MSKQPNRQRCQPKVYTESDFRQALRRAAMELEGHHMKLAIASFALALHRELGLDADKIGDVLARTNELSYEALCFTDVQQEVKAATGLDIKAFVEGL